MNILDAVSFESFDFVRKPGWNPQTYFLTLIPMTSAALNHIQLPTLSQENSILGSLTEATVTFTTLSSWSPL